MTHTPRVPRADKISARQSARQSADMDILISCRIKKLRKLYGMTAVHFDHMTGFSKGTTGRLERNEQRICASHLINMCQTTGVSLAYFYAHKNVTEMIPHTSHDQEKISLLKAYRSIKNSTLKRNIFELIEMLAQSSNAKIADKS